MNDDKPCKKLKHQTYFPQLSVWDSFLLTLAPLKEVKINICQREILILHHFLFHLRDFLGYSNDKLCFKIAASYMYSNN